MTFLEIARCIIALLLAGGVGVLLGMFEKEMNKLEIMEFERRY